MPQALHNTMPVSRSLRQRGVCIVPQFSHACAEDPGFRFPAEVTGPLLFAPVLMARPPPPPDQSLRAATAAKGTPRADRGLRARVFTASSDCLLPSAPSANSRTTPHSRPVWASLTRAILSDARDSAAPWMSSNTKRSPTRRSISETRARSAAAAASDEASSSAVAPELMALGLEGRARLLVSSEEFSATAEALRRREDGGRGTRSWAGGRGGVPKADGGEDDDVCCTAAFAPRLIPEEAEARGGAAASSTGLWRPWFFQ